MSRITFDNINYSINDFLIFVNDKINKKENINFQDNNMNTVLMLASRYSNTNSSLETVKELIKTGANLDLQNNDGWTALMLASRYSNTDSSLETVKELIKAGANLDLQHNNGCSALIFASSNSKISSSSLETVQELIKAGTNLDLQNNKGMTALMTASFYSSKNTSQETVRELIKAGANLNLHNYYNDTCLSYIIKYSKSLELVKEIFSKNVSINHLTKNSNNINYKYNGNSLLHWCIIGIKEDTSTYEILRYLETLDIDKTLKNQEEKTYKDYLDKPDYYLSLKCQICYNNKEIITILNCSCRSTKQCLDCSKNLIKCCFCRELFDNYKIIRII